MTGCPASPRPPRSIVANWSAATVIHGPTSPSGHWTRTSALVRVAEADVDPAELAAGVPAPDRDLPDDGAVADPHLDPRADGIDVRRRLLEPDRDPVTHRLRLLGVARADVAPQRGGLARG